MSATSSSEVTYRDMVSVNVLDRQLFYNNSAYDGQSAAINSADDGAIATDKVALLPGQTASFANYSSYAGGINGLMIDVAGLPSFTLSASDFTFRTGNSNDPSSWVLAPDPTAISVRVGAGISGSSRVEITWADGAIQKKWLQVTMNATPNTGLTTPDVFYFGNAIGETGNSSGDAIVDAVDAQAIHDHPSAAPPAPVTSLYDINRDGVVNATDESISTASATNASSALKLLSVPTASYTPPPERLPISLFNWGAGGFPVYNNPALATTNSGVVLAFAEGRATSQDVSSYAIVMRRSTDGGATWSDPVAIYSVDPGTGVVIYQASPIVDKITGQVFLLFNRGRQNPVTLLNESHDCFVMSTSDDGLTWTSAVDITESVTVTEAGNPGPPGAYPPTPWGWSVVGPGHGIQLTEGPYAGRLLIGGDHRETTDNSGKSFSHVIYSDDHGVTWHLGGGLEGDPDLNVVGPDDWSNENMLVELPGGTIYMTIRVQKDQVHYRGAAYSTDGGTTWTDMFPQTQLFVYQVEGSIIRLNDDVLLFASPASTDNFDEIRHELTIWASYDNALTWVKKKVINYGYSGYSDMTLVGPDTILLSFARGYLGGLGAGDNNAMGYTFYDEIGLARINLAWLESPDPPQFTWYFNEGAAGTRADSAGYSIMDYGPYDVRAWGRAANRDLAPMYVAGRGNDTALHLSTTVGSNGVLLTPAYDTALYAEPDDSFTVEIDMSTTDPTGVIIGTRPTVRNWTLQVVDGKVQFSLFDTVNTPTITSTNAINDGAWHHIVAVRDAVNRQLKLYIDGVAAADPVVDTATTPIGALEHVPVDAMYMGVYNTIASASKLDMTVDTLRFTRAALTPDQFLPDVVVAPPAYPLKTYSAGAPTSLPGLQLWLPPYDPTRYFADFGSFANPLPLDPYPGMPSRSMNDASPIGYRVQTGNQYRAIMYGDDPQIGPYWIHTAAPDSAFGTELQVHSLTSGPTAKRFDFVQNTGVFTLSTFVKMGAPTGGYMTIFDTSEASPDKPGFSLFLRQDGSVFLTVTGGTAQTVRFFAAAPNGNLNPNQWYHVAVVGNGPGNPVTFYITPVGSANVATYTSAGVLAGDNGTYTTDSSHGLYIGQRANSSSGGSPFNGGLVNEAIFDQALTPAQIQQLFVFGKSFADNPTPWKNPTEPMDIDGNGRVSATDALLLISRLLNNQGGALADPTPGNMPPPYLDPNGDGRLSAQDALGVISWLLTHHAAQPQGATSAAQVASAEEQPAASVLPSDNTIASVPIVEPAAISFTAAPQDVPSADLALGSTTTETTEQPTSSAPQSASILMVQPRYVAATSQVSAYDEAISDSDLSGCEYDGMPVDEALARTLAIRRRARARATA